MREKLLMLVGCIVLCIQAEAGKFVVRSQQDWDRIPFVVNEAIKKGDNSILIDIKAKWLEYGKNSSIVLNDINNPSLNLRIKGNGVTLVLAGNSFELNESTTVVNKHYKIPLKTFSIGTIFFDENFTPIEFKEPVSFVEGKIEPVDEYGCFFINQGDRAPVAAGMAFNSNTMYKRYNVYRFYTGLSDLSEQDSKDVYMTLTRQWCSYIHKVVKIEKGYVYFKFVADEAFTNTQKYYLEPDCDITGYQIKPRYRMINRPSSNEAYYQNGMVYIPARYKNVKCSNGGSLIRMNGCVIGSLDIKGINFIGSGVSNVLNFVKTQFKNSATIENNTFEYFNAYAISAVNCSNITVKNNRIFHTRIGAIRVGNNCKSCIVCDNTLKDIGWMGQTSAISIGGDHVIASGNKIEDFIYAAISGGGSGKKGPNNIVFDISNNEIGYTQYYAGNYLKNTLCDGGAIYIGPQTDRGVIRDNVIYNYCGNGANRAIYLDDGCKNLEIYGNLVLRPTNVDREFRYDYDIDLRRCTTYYKEIPDYNTNNYIHDNIITGAYKFEGKGDNDGCRKGKNYVVETGGAGDNILTVNDSEADIEVGQGVIIDQKLYLSKSAKEIIGKSRISRKVSAFIVYK